MSRYVGIDEEGLPQEVAVLIDTRDEIVDVMVFYTAPTGTALVRAKAAASLTPHKIKDSEWRPEGDGMHSCRNGQFRIHLSVQR